MRTRVTLSFDDGHPNDLRLAALLKRRGLKATFYLPLGNAENPVLSAAQMRRLAGMGFEVGSHGLSHRRLHGMPELEARRELFLSAQGLRRATGRAPRGFAFSGGKYHGLLPHWAAQEGYDYARTTRMFRQGRMRAGNLLHTSLQWYPHGWAAYARHILRRPSPAAAGEFLRSRRGSLAESAKALFGEALAWGRPFHLWAHSYDLAEKAQWRELEAFLEFLSARRDVDYVDNAGLFDALVPA